MFLCCPKKNLLRVFSVCIVLFLISCTNTTKVFKKNIEDGPFDAIIIPGCPFEDSTWSSLMKIRVHWAAFLYHKGYANNVIFSGNAVYSPYYESKIMGLYAEKLGIDPNHIFFEDRAEHSTENVYYGKLIADSLGFGRVALATDPFQTSMLKGFVKKRNIGVHALPIIFDTLNSIDLYSPSINPSSAYCDGFTSLRERESWFERWRGTRGKHIKWNK